MKVSVECRALLALVVFLPTVADAVVLRDEDFEDCPNGFSINGTLGGNIDDYLDCGTNGAPFNFESGNVTGFDGISFIGLEDIDGAGFAVPNYVELTPVNVAGYENLSVSFLVAFPSGTATRYEVSDFLRLQYSMDGGSFQTLGSFIGGGAVGAGVGMLEDTDLDGTHDVVVSGLAMQRFTYSLDARAGSAVTGSSMVVRVFFNSDGSMEEMAFDSIIVEGSPGTPAPTVTDGNISIGGASGTAGAFRIGDTVTATWNNTAGGDNNAGVTAVTVDFSQFGGGAAVAASESSGSWTATYVLTAGAIDATSRNVSVSATNPGGTSTTADTTNATVDSIAPSVTDANLSINGASGTSGAYRIGDTVTATWNNTAGGDNNTDTISAVTVDFSQFGGGGAVPATNSAGTWTATYTLIAGAIDMANRNVSISVTDNAGNVTVTADTTNATADTIAPTVTDGNISINSGTGSGGAFVPGNTVIAIWNNTAGGDNNSDAVDGATVDFSQFGGGSAVAASQSAGTWTASYTLPGGAPAGSNLNVSVTATDNAGNTSTRADTSNASIVAAAPTVTDANISISGATGTAGAFRIGDTVTASWNNTAGGDNNASISGVTVDFSAFGGGSAVVASNNAGIWTATHLLTAGAIDALGANVSVTATSAGGNSTTADTTGATVDTIAPAVTGIQLAGTPASNAASVQFEVSLDDGFDNLDPSDFELTSTGTATGNIAPPAKTPGNQTTITVNGISGSGTLRLDLRAVNDIVDDAGNGPAAPFDAGAVHTVARSAPTLGAASSASVLEDDASLPLAITVGDSETDPDALTLTVNSDAQAVVTDAALAMGLGGSGTARSLVVAPEANANGSATLTLAVTDEDMQTTTATLALTVTPVNDAPSASIGDEQRWPSGEAGMKQVAGFASALSAGPANESSQTLSGVSEIVSDPEGVLGMVNLLGSGTLNYTLSGNDGAALVRFAVRDDGGTANGGVDTSVVEERRIVVGGGVDISVVIRRGNFLLRKGNTQEFTVTVKNNGPDAAEDIRIRMPLADGLVNTAWTCSAPSPCTPASGSGASAPVAGSSAVIDTTFDLADREHADILLSGESTGLSVELVVEAELPEGQTLRLPFDDRRVLVEVISGQGISRSGFE